LGEWNLSSVLDCADKKNCIYEPVQDITIEQIITNNDYDISDESMHNDIAILRIARRATYNYFVRPICLPIIEKLHITNLADGVRFTVAGWEQTETRTKTNVKLKSDVKSVSMQQCQQVFPNRIIWYKHLCAGGIKKKKTCNGDSGRPLMKEMHEGRLRYWYMAGIFSFGHRACGLENVPEVYTNVGVYLEWILRNIRP
jgi:secreted trypsin-like serine protease